jgi:hypothetical protein
MPCITIKHTMLPLPDLAVEYEIDPVKKVVHVHLSHLDSHCLITFAQTLERLTKRVRLIDNLSHTGTAPAWINDMHELHVTVFGVTLRACITQLFRHTDRGDPQFTVTVEPLAKAPVAVKRSRLADTAEDAVFA